MRCEDVREGLPLLDGADPASAPIFEHLVSCAECARLAKAFEADRTRLAGAGRVPPSLAPNPSVFWRELEPRLERSPGARILVLFRPSVMAAAAMLALSVGLGIVLMDRVDRPRDQSGGAAVVSGPAGVDPSLASGGGGLEPALSTDDPNLRPLAPVRRGPPVLERLRPPSERTFPLEEAEPARVRPVDWEF